MYKYGMRQGTRRGNLMNKGSRGKAIVCIRLIAMSSGLCIFRYSFQYFKIIRNVIYLMSSILLTQGCP